MRKRQYKRLISTLMTGTIIAALTALYWFVWTHFYTEKILLHSIPYGSRGQLLAVSIYVILLLVFSGMYSTNKIEVKRIADIIVSQSLAVVFTNVITYFQICLMAHGFINPAPLAGITLCDIVVVILWAVLSKRVYRRVFPAYRMLLLYQGSEPEGVAAKFSGHKDRYAISGRIDVSEGLEEVLSELKNYDGAIMTDQLSAGLRERITMECFERSVPLYLLPSVSDIILSGAGTSNIFDSPVLVCHNCGLRAENVFAKRVLDLVLIIPICIIMLPIMLVIALLIKLYDGGTVFYKQQRLTQDGRVFWIYKFRSMRMDSEKGQAQLAKKHDSRITPIGGVLRFLHFDELPQIINILKGDMSIVGPRPERPEIAEQYCSIIPEFKYRLKVKAGLTGYAQVFGKYNTEPIDKLKLDLYYIQHQNLLLDIELIFKTVSVLFKKDNTEGIESWQTTAADKKSAGEKTEGSEKEKVLSSGRK